MIVYALENTLYTINDDKKTVSLREKLTQIVSNYVEDACKKYPQSPRDLLTRIPAIMELYNIVSSDSFTYNGKEYPTESSKEISKKILSSVSPLSINWSYILLPYIML